MKKLIFLLTLSTINLQSMTPTGLRLRRLQQQEDPGKEMTVYSSLPQQEIAQPEVAAIALPDGNLATHLGLPNNEQIKILRRYLEGKKGQRFFPKEVQTVGVHINVLRRIMAGDVPNYSDVIDNICILDRNRVVVTSSNDTTIWDISTNKFLGKMNQTKLIQIISPTKLAYVENGKTIVIIDRSSTKTLKKIAVPDEVKSITAISPNKIIVFAGYADNIYIWDINTGQCLRKITRENKHYVSSIAAISPNKFITCEKKRNVAAISPDKFVVADSNNTQIFDVNTGECLQTLNVGGKAVVLSPNNIATICSGNIIQILDIDTGKCLRQIQMPNWRLSVEGIAAVSQNEIAILYNSIHTHPDFGTTDKINGKIEIYDINNGKCLYTLDNGYGQLCCMAVVSPGKIVFSSTRTIKTWNFRSGSDQIENAIKDTFNVNNPLALLLATQGNRIPEKDKKSIRAQLVESDGSVENWLKTVDPEFRNTATKALTCK
jgi:WD40 repeat protein